ncbi:MAG: radical SAM family heme chaperone HemW [Planctomycetales bacterium]|nr:radical SAM family heme chaperone HemW [Planctomycetales bacterium]
MEISSGNERQLPAAYVHVPFCRHRCGYCNFTLVSGRDDLIDQYLKAIELELATIGETVPISTLYIGGGTPTHLSGQQLQRLLSSIGRTFSLCNDLTTAPEFSVEANPADIDEEKINVLYDAGVNRISLGAQSFNAAKLKRLERDHTADIIRSAVSIARIRIKNVSLDLIFAAPEESVDDWKRDLEQAIAVDPNHISTYGLTIERGTTFWNRQLHNDLHPLDEETQRTMYELAVDKLTSAGFEHYEVSNFAKPNFRSAHNENYWLGGEYYAVGPGAARYLNRERSMNHQSTTTYIKGVLAGQSPIVDREKLSDEDIARERLVFGLRRIEGIDVAGFHRETGFTIDELAQPALGDFIAADLLRYQNDRLTLTREGLIVSDSIWPRFLVP